MWHSCNLGPFRLSCSPWCCAQCVAARAQLNWCHTYLIWSPSIPSDTTAPFFCIASNKTAQASRQHRCLLSSQVLWISIATRSGFIYFFDIVVRFLAHSMMRSLDRYFFLSSNWSLRCSSCTVDHWCNLCFRTQQKNEFLLGIAHPILYLALVRKADTVV